ncbi:MAG: 50S ribosomal protein L19 [Parcubacteria group bacterium]|nr:50S ribosomal protein L19 [Parcubacteria group bacterium]
MITLSPVNINERRALLIRAGDTVRVWQKIKDEKGKIRLQAFEGLVIARKHGREPGATFTVRKIASGVGVEKIFPLYSPVIDKIEVIRRSKVRRSKLYYIREKTAREIRRKMKGLADFVPVEPKEEKKELPTVLAAENSEAVEAESTSKGPVVLAAEAKSEKEN